MTLTLPSPPPVRTPGVEPPHPPLLREGDLLTRDEFERRYDAEPDLKKAELICGRVHLSSPVSIAGHAFPHARLATWLGNYQDATPGTLIADNGSVRLDDRNMPQPDLLLMIEPECGGRAGLSREGYGVGGPEFVAEVSHTSGSFDLRDKFQVYEEQGVEEYLVWRTAEGELDWFVRRDGKLERLAPDPDGIYRSQVFPGLWLDGEALLRQHRGRVRQVLEQGLAGPEHAAFVQALADRRAALADAVLPTALPGTE